MFNTIFGEFPINYYTCRDYSKAIDALANDVLSFTSSVSTTSYSLKEIDNNIVFDCIAPSITKEDLIISFKDRNLSIKTSNKLKDLPYFTPINMSLPLRKDIDIKSSFAELEKGVLKITMPLKTNDEENKISFR